MLKLSEKVNSKTPAEGEFGLDEDLKVGDIAIATAGAVALGRISRADRSVRHACGTVESRAPLSRQLVLSNGPRTDRLGYS